MLAVFVALKFTVLPRWMTLLTPGILFLLTPLIKKLPKGIVHMVVCGGWSNLISVIYDVVAIAVLLD